jgi:hypothetical protein
MDPLPTWPYDGIVVAPELREAYETAVFEVVVEGDTLVLSLGHSPLLPAVLAETTLAVVTAYNPGAERPSEAENRAANADLADYLQANGWRWLPALGCSQDRSHCEPSFGVLGLKEQEAVELGQWSRQDCVFFWDGSAGRLLWMMEG